MGTRNTYCEVLSIYKVKIKAFPKETCSPTISVLKIGTSIKEFQINLHSKERKKGLLQPINYRIFMINLFSQISNVCFEWIKLSMLPL